MRKAWLACALLVAAGQAGAQNVNPAKPWTQIGDTNGAALGTSTNPFYTAPSGTAGTQPVNVVSSNYFAETSTPLAANATFTGTTRDAGTPTSYYAKVNAIVVCDVTSATVRIQISNDGTNFFNAITAATVAGMPLILSVPVVARYARLSITNGGTAMTSLQANFSFTVA